MHIAPTTRLAIRRITAISSLAWITIGPITTSPILAGLPALAASLVTTVLSVTVVSLLIAPLVQRRLGCWLTDPDRHLPWCPATERTHP